jgi:iron complex outermembrane receptor protein
MKRGRPARLSRLSLVAAACAAAPVGVLPARSQAQVEVSEVVVTARKLREALFDVPVVETALPQRTLERLQIYNLKDVATLTPGLVMGEALAYGEQASIRGVGAAAPAPGVDQSVALVIDDLPLSQGLAYSSGMFDIRQIEVLKGPQALFYGRASSGGVISVRTADPTDRAELVGQAGRDFEADEWRSEFVLSGPLGAGFRARLAAMYSTQEGYFTNAATGLAATGARDPASRRLFPTTAYQIRGTALWAPNARFDARLKLNVAHERTLYFGTRQYVLCPDGTGAPAGIPFIGGGEDCRLDRTYRTVDYDPALFSGIESPTPANETTQAYGTLELDYRISPALDLTAVTGSYKLDTGTEVNGNGSTFAAPSVAVRANSRTVRFTQEVRLSSDFAGPVNFTAGAYYESAAFRNLVNQSGNRAYRLPAVLAKGAHYLDMLTYSAFGQARWKILPRLELAAGARWEDEKRSDTGVDLASGTPVAVPLPTPVIRARRTSPELTLTFKPTDEVMVFGALKRGYKSGSFNVTFPPKPGLDNAFGDEKVEGGEGGVKTRLLDRRLALDLAGYDYRYSDMQVAVAFQGPTGLPFARTVNAGSALVYGVEFDVSFRPVDVDGLDLHVAGNWNHARFKSFHGAPCYGGQTIAAGCNEDFSPQIGLFTAQDLSGTPLLKAPEWQVSFGLDYERPIGHGLVLVVGNANQYSAKYKADLGFPYYQPAFIKTDLSLALQGPRDRWEFALIGKNLGGALTTGNCFNQNSQNGLVFGGQITGGTGRGLAGVDEIACFIDRGREVWLRLTLRPLS